MRVNYRMIATPSGRLREGEKRTKSMTNKNIVYRPPQIKGYYSCNRSTWEDFYRSERWVFTKLAGSEGFLGDGLDVGCACGGLGAALSQNSRRNSYTGVDINRPAPICPTRENLAGIDLT